MMAEKWKDRETQLVHCTLSVRKVKRGRGTTTACGLVVDDMMRLAPHSDRAKEPPMTCPMCVYAISALSDYVENSHL